MRDKVIEIGPKLLENINWGSEECRALQNSVETQKLIENWLKTNYTAFEVFNRSGETSLLDDWKIISAGG